MGNQLVGVAPSQIFPVEHYLSDHADLSFDQSLGSTRFLKVARARSREGLIVVKVFAVHDPSLPLAEHKERILKIKEQLVSAFNCLPFQRVILTDKAGLLMREYCKCSVYDRMSTRPFLTVLEKKWITFQVLYALHRMHKLGICHGDIKLTDKAGLLMREYCKCSVYDRMSTRPFLTVLEKKWITFQVLYALHRMHKLGICHGDIKLENIMVTSWLWVLLTDIASFKPTFLPDDNPADFSYFFDTSRRRLCYVAPERFVKAPDPSYRPSGDDRTGGLLLSESPCKVGELLPSMDIFSAGCALLELWNEGTPALDLPGLLAYRNGEDRPSTMTLPEGSEPGLRELLHSMTERNPKDRKSAEIYLDEARGKLFPEYFYSFLQSYMLIFSAQPILPADEKILRIHQDIKNIIKIFTQPSDAKNYKDLVEETTENNNTDNIETLMKEGFKVMNINVTDFEEENDSKAPEKREMGPDSEGLILITSLVTSCIRGLHHCTSKLYCLEILQLLCENSSSEIILDRILPYIIHLSHDVRARVRSAAMWGVTRCLAHVVAPPPAGCNVFPEYILPELAPRAADSALPVRIAYANNIAKLAETAVRFLDQTQNMADKETANINYETELSALHEMVRSTVSYLLTDSQAVVKRALVENGITKLCVFFGKQKANDVILSHMVTFLNDKEEAALRGCFFERVVGVAAYVGQHSAPILLPLLQQGLTDQSEWIIAKALRATSSLAELGLLPKQALCDLLAESAVYLAHPNLWVERAELLLESLADPIPRKVLDAVLRHGDVDRLVHTLRERRNTRLRVKQGTMPQYCEMGQQLKNLFRRLASDGMTEHVENQLLAMSAHLIKIQSSTTQHITEAPGRLVLSSSSGISRCVQLEPAAVEPHTDKLYNTQPSGVSGVSGAPAAAQPAHSQMGHSASYVQYSMAPCRIELRNLTARMQQKYQKSLRSHEDNGEGGEDLLPPPSWRPGNQLLAYLHEHKARVNQLARVPSVRGLFASCSDDGTVRLWDANRLQGHAYVNKSKSMYNRSAGPVISLASCEGGQSLVAATQEGSIFVLRMDSGSSRMTLSQCRQVSAGSAGAAEGCVACACAGGVHAGVISYATLNATVVGWDLRAPGNAWKLQGDLKQGVYTCLYANSAGYVAVGTSSGAICVWDLRFQLPITTVRHPNSERVRRIVGWGGLSSRVWSVGGRDAAAWCLEAAQRTHALWPCTNTSHPLNYSTPVIFTNIINANV
ncbi:Phosphoinositide 3-kinase regulatory subunit 4 [Papilio machaon]|uniref:non-specific serine/threonine protein kinase n=1 Tax=Papilio machaon TaxID=76193 RepID=A0A0N1IGU5_PAPMA|nr:Phosphoinositide 3-kinase regulatory subunit 4 [Papilio machaon]